MFQLQNFEQMFYKKLKKNVIEFHKYMDSFHTLCLDINKGY